MICAEGYRSGRRRCTCIAAEIKRVWVGGNEMSAPGLSALDLVEDSLLCWPYA